MPTGSRLAIEAETTNLVSSALPAYTGATRSASQVLSRNDTGQGMKQEVMARVFDSF